MNEILARAVNVVSEKRENDSVRYQLVKQVFTAGQVEVTVADSETGRTRTKTYIRIDWANMDQRFTRPSSMHNIEVNHTDISRLYFVFKTKMLASDGNQTFETENMMLYLRKEDLKELRAVLDSDF